MEKKIANKYAPREARCRGVEVSSDVRTLFQRAGLKGSRFD
jgi:hypothetical protein